MPAPQRLALWKGLSVLSIRYRMLIISRKAMVPPSRGGTTQLATIKLILPYTTASTPMPAMANLTTAPSMEWVVDTGQPRVEATMSQIAAASSGRAYRTPGSRDCARSCWGR